MKINRRVINLTYSPMFDDEVKNVPQPTNPPAPAAAPTPTPASAPAAVPAPESKEPEDIFAGTSDMPTPPAAKTQAPPQGLPTASGAPVPPSSPAGNTATVQAVPPVTGGSRGMIMIAVLALLVVVLGIGGYMYYSKVLNERLEARTVLPELTETAEDINPEAVKESVVELLETASDVETEPAVEEVPAQPAEEVSEQEASSEPLQETVDETVPVQPADTDNDGLPDAQEAELGTDPAKTDTDGDGLFDKEEVVTYGTDPLKTDSDGDGYGDKQEIEAGYNPLGEGKLLPPITDVQ